MTFFTMVRDCIIKRDFGVVAEEVLGVSCVTWSVFVGVVGGAAAGGCCSCPWGYEDHTDS